MRFEFSGTRELYLEIAEKYKSYIENGVMREGEKLPSVRQAALELGVNPNTVARAYSILENEGYIKSIPKKGVYVNGSFRKNSESANTEQEETNTPDLREEIKKLLDSGISKEELLSQIEEVFSSGKTGKAGDGK